MQIFKKPHRARLKGTQVVRNIFKAKTIQCYGCFQCTDSNTGHLGISYLAMRGKTIVTVSTNLTVNEHKFHSKNFSITKKERLGSKLMNFNGRPKSPLFALSGNTGNNNGGNGSNSGWGQFSNNNVVKGSSGPLVRNQFTKKHSSSLFLKNLCFAVDDHGYYLFACGFDDGSFIQYNVQHQRIEEEFHEHSDIVSCLAVCD